MHLNIQKIRESFGAIKPHAEDVMSYFYELLFEKHPQFKKMLKVSNLDLQKKEMMSALDYLITHWDQEDKIDNYLLNKGKNFFESHLATEENVSCVTDTFLEMMEYFLENHWTAELRNEWTQFYQIVGSKIQKGKGITMELVAEKQHVSLSEYARQCAKKLLHSAIETESNQSYKQVAREKARGVLIEALELETELALKDENLSSTKVA